ncbi:helix-turn-helix domain-containing protein [Streptomyces nojiriensis]|uniref:helix-turn-helix domain-containing protein n=1 Tax=Streptomyces nojiriensis TaxID=66374 RepID=UPI0035E1EA32
MPIDEAQRLLARRISGETGMGAIAGRFLETLESHGAECAPGDLDRLGRVAADLLTACLAGQHSGAGERTGSEPPADPGPRALLERIDTFIGHNLGDPGLTPRSVADRHHISVRRLHLMFQDRGEGVAATIRRLRLEHCHADLARPELLDRPIRTIAARWGFGSAAAFSRAFREAYGISPTERRAQAPAAVPCRARPVTRTGDNAPWTRRHCTN